MKAYLPVVFSMLFGCGNLAAGTFTDLKGNWKGLWAIEDTASSRLYLRISKSGSGVYSSRLDALDSGANNISSTGVSNNPPYVRIDFSNIGLHFEGTIDSEFIELDGVWSNGVNTWPVKLNRNPGIDEMQPRTFSNAFGTLPYRLFVPANYNAGQIYPLVLFMHGAGERGSDNRIQITAHTAALAFTFNENQARQPCFLVAPQCPIGGSWVDTARRSQVPALIAALKTEFNIDADRVYATGLSMGGIGTWDLLSRNASFNANLFAAGIPMSGSTSASASTFYQIPVWNFHAANDGVVSVTGSRNAVAAMRNLGGAPIYTEYAAGGHGIWTAAYSTPMLFDWIMAQKRQTITNVPPFITIQSPSEQPLYATAGSTVSLTGVAGDAATKISRITWTNNRGGSGNAVGTNNWSIPVVGLQTGTNLLTVQSTGTAWVSDYGGTTTFSDVIRVQRVALPVLSISRTNELVKVAWEGGIAPVLEKSIDLATGTWEAVQTEANSAILPADQPEAYFRLRSQ